MLGGAGAGKDLCSAPAPGTKRPGAPQPGTPAFQLQQVVCAREDLNIVQVLRSEVNSELNFPSNFEGLVLGCIDADFCK